MQFTYNQPFPLIYVPIDPRTLLVPPDPNSIRMVPIGKPPFYPRAPTILASKPISLAPPLSKMKPISIPERSQPVPKAFAIYDEAHKRNIERRQKKKNNSSNGNWRKAAAAKKIEINNTFARVLEDQDSQRHIERSRHFQNDHFDKNSEWGQIYKEIEKQRLFFQNKF